MGRRSNSRNARRTKKGRRAFKRKSTKSKTKRRGATFSRRMRGGTAPFSSPHVTGHHAQFQNNLPVSTSYSTGGKLSPALSMLANPAPFSKLANAAIDNLNHSVKNSFGNIGSGMGFPSQGW